MKHHTSFLKVSRLEGLTDGVFAIAMTILVFGITLPAGTEISRLSAFLTTNVLEKIFIYMGSFIILGTQWVGINFQHGFLERINRPYLWMNIFFLMGVGIVPFSAGLLIDYPRSPISISFYAVNLMCVSITQIIIWQSGSVYKLYNADYTKVAHKAVLYRICVPLIFYLTALLIAHWHTKIAFIILVMPPLFHIFPGKVDKYIRKRESGL